MGEREIEEEVGGRWGEREREEEVGEDGGREREKRR